MDDPEAAAIRQRLRQELASQARTGAGAPVALTGDSFDAFLASSPIVLIDFWADWCAPCHMMDPVLDELAQEWNGRVALGKVNVDEEQDLSFRFRVSGIPTFLFFKDGKLAGHLVGARPKRDFKDIVAQLEPST